MPGINKSGVSTASSEFTFFELFFTSPSRHFHRTICPTSKLFLQSRNILNSLQKGQRFLFVKLIQTNLNLPFGAFESLFRYVSQIHYFPSLGMMMKPSIKNGQ